MRHRVLFLGVVVWFLVCSLVYADVPKLINFQGRLTDASGKFVPDGNYSLTFRIYSDSTGGSAKWSEGQLVAVNKGLFNVILGSATPIPDSIFNYLNTYLGIQVGADPEMTPRQRLSSLGYAYRGAKADTSSYAMNSDKLDGFHASDFSSIGTDFGRSGVASDLYEGMTKLVDKYLQQGQANSITSSMIADSTITNADISPTANISPSKISGTAWTSNNDGSGSGLDADLLDGQQGSYYTNAGNISSGSLADSRLSANVDLLSAAQIFTGVKTFNPSSGSVPFAVDATKNGAVTNLNADLLDGQQASAFLSTSGDYGRSGVATDLYEGTSTLTNKYVNVAGPDSVVATSGTALLGKSKGSNTSAMYGIQGYADNSSTGPSYGVYGTGMNSSTGQAFGGYFTTWPVTGSGYRYGVYSQGSGSSSYPTYAYYGDASNNGSGDAYGGFFITASSGTGVHYGTKADCYSASSASTYGSYGKAENTSSGNAYGGLFQASSAGTGTHTGVVGQGYSSSSSSAAGVAGTADNTSNGDAVGGYFTTSASGTGPHFGVQAICWNASAAPSYGVNGGASNTSTGSAYGGYFSTSGSGTGSRFGVSGIGYGSSSYPVYGSYGLAANTSNGLTYGGYFVSDSIGTGVHYGARAEGYGNTSTFTYGSYGYASNSSDGSVHGGYFETSNAGTGEHYAVRTLAAGNSSNRSVGVWGQADNAGYADAYGVFGWADQYGTGDVYGVFGYVRSAAHATAYGGYFTTPFAGSGERYGVLAASAGTSDSSTYGVYGSAFNTSTGDVYAGYFSASYGVGTGAYHGVYAVAENASSSAAYGTCSYARNTSSGNVYAGYFAADSIGTGGEYGIYAQASTVHWAGWFQGDLGVSHNSYVYGNSYVSGTKSAAVKVENGEYRAMYSQESPENWFEDFGEGRLSNGKTHIELDQTFLQTVTIDNLHPMKVFVQLEGECNGVFVTKGTTGFDVTELKGGVTNAAFSYRVVAKRKGYEDIRLTKLVGKTADVIALEQAKNQAEFASERVKMQEEQKRIEQRRQEMEKERQ